MRFSILTLFPEYFESPLRTSLVGRAQESGLLNVDYVNLREFGEGKYRAVDDKPYGGGAGMVMMPSVLERALGKLVGEEKLGALEESVAAARAAWSAKVPGPANRADAETASASPQPDLPHVIFLSPQGRKLDSAIARRLATKPHLALICGHYEGIDERATESFVHEEISIGDYVLTGGEPAAVVLLDAISRFIPGVVGEKASVEGDTFEGAGSKEMLPGGLKYPMYTRPAEWRGRKVPSVLLSGHHAEIAKWRLAESESRTAHRRPDLMPGKPEIEAKGIKAKAKRTTQKGGRKTAKILKK